MRDDYVPSDYEDLYQHYFAGTGGWVAGVIRRYFPRSDQAVVEDLLHETWMRMYRLRLIERFDPERGNFGLLVFQAARSECLNALEAKRRKSWEVLVDLVDEHDEAVCQLSGRDAAEAVHSQVEAREILDRVERAVRAASEAGETARDRALGPMIEMLANGATARQVAKRFGVCNATVSYWRDYVEQAATA